MKYMTEAWMREGKVTHLEMNGAGGSKPTLGRCSILTLNSVIY